MWYNSMVLPSSVLGLFIIGCIILDSNTHFQKKTYYVDGYEHPDTVVYCKKYVSQYLQDELRCFRWVQLSEPEVDKIEKDFSDFSRSVGYGYKCKESGHTFYEFHVDDHETFHDKFSEDSFGGNLSVRKINEDWSIIMIGQDECIYKQF